MRFYDCFIVTNNFAVSLTAIKELIEEGIYLVTGRSACFVSRAGIHTCFRERSGSVVECLTQDRRAVGSSLTGVTALWSLSKTHLS